MNPAQQRELFAQAIVTESGLEQRDEFAQTRFDSWLAFLRGLAGILPDDRQSIVIIDEIPYLAAADAAFEGALQAGWDRYLSRKPVLFIGVGSDLAMMELINTYGRPFYQRAKEMILRPLTPAAVGRLIGLPPAEAFDAALITGGLPLICREWHSGESVERYLKRTLADPVSALLVSAERSLAAEFPSDVQARRVVSTIGGSGARTFGTIAALASEGAGPLSGTSLTKALGHLAEKRLIGVDTPLSTRAAPKDKRYSVTDSYLRFWLTFVQPAMPLIERDRSDIVLRRWRERWTTWRGEAIEPMVREAVERSLGATPWELSAAVGSWWPRSNNPQLDLVIADKGPVATSISCVGSIKWREKAPFGDRDQRALAGDALAVPGVTADTPLVAVARTKVEAGGLAHSWTAEDLIEAWR